MDYLNCNKFKSEP